MLLTGPPERTFATSRVQHAGVENGRRCTFSFNKVWLPKRSGRHLWLET